LPLKADVVDRRAEDEAQGLESRVLDEQELVDRQVAREELRALSVAAHAAQAIGGARRQVGGGPRRILGHDPAPCSRCYIQVFERIHESSACRPRSVRRASASRAAISSLMKTSPSMGSF